MLEEIITPVTVWVLTSVLSAAVGVLGVLLKQEAKRRAEEAKRQHAMEAGTRIFLRSQLRMMHERYVVDNKPCSIEAKEEAADVYNAYHDLGGNGVGTHLYEEIKEAHISKER